MFLFYVLILDLVAVGVSAHESKSDPHGGIPHGILNPHCDNNLWHLEVDWDPYDPHNSQNYTCKGYTLNPVHQGPDVYCQSKKELKNPTHVCYPSPIHYEDNPPMSGAHRPLWPLYGEYIFLPAQRWLHALEHGAVALLYHPCADQKEVAHLRKLVTNCIRKHIITPYNLPPDTPLALVTWGCRLLMTHTDIDLSKQFIQEHAMHGGESHLVSDGQYGYFLIKQAHIVSDLHESALCPDIPVDKDELHKKHGTVTKVRSKTAAEDGQRNVAKDKQGQHKVTKPEHEQHKVTKPEHEKHKVTKPEHEQHKVTKAEHEQHKVTKPEHEQHKVTKPEHGQHKVTKPEHEQHKVTKPEHEQHKVTKAVHGQHKVTKPEHEQHKVTKAEHEQHKVTKPEHEQHKVTKPEHEQHKVTKPEHEQHKVTKAVHGQHKVTKPEHGQHKVTKPEHEQHKVTKPEHEQHKVTKPEHGQHKVTKAKQGQHKKTKCKHGQDKLTEQVNYLVEKLTDLKKLFRRKVKPHVPVYV